MKPITIKDTSWHYKLLDALELNPSGAKSICPYGRKLLLVALMFLFFSIAAIIFLIVIADFWLTLYFALAFPGLMDWGWGFQSPLLGSPVWILPLLGGAVQLFLLAIFVSALDHEYDLGIGDTITKAKQAVKPSEGTKASSFVSLIGSFLHASHNKVCPPISIIYTERERYNTYKEAYADELVRLLKEESDNNPMDLSQPWPRDSNERSNKEHE